MKKIITGCFVTILLMFATILTGCDSTKIYFDNKNINTVVEFGSEISFEDWYLTQKDGDSVSKIAITQDMIVSCDSTDSVGEKELVLKYQDKTYKVKFVVKYRVDFWVDSEIYNTQYVLSASEIEYPQTPEIIEYEFVDWYPREISEISNNMSIQANLTVISTGLPLLTTYNATYGDTLQDVVLPQNSNGKWEFVDAKTTSVGNAGDNYFDVQFVPFDPNLVVAKTDEVKVRVAKKNVSFQNINQTFVYDGEIKTPTFDLSIPGLNTLYIPYYLGEAIEVGEYEYEIEIDENNYTGLYSGTMIINAAKAIIDISDKTIKYSDAYPSTFEYEVLDEEEKPLEQSLIDLMGIKIIEPIYQHTGTFEIDASVSNANFDVTINAGYLYVQKVEHDLTDSEPVLTSGGSVVYSSTLGEVTFEDSDVRGVWSWQNPAFVVTTTEPFKANVIFTPKQDQDYLSSTKEITLTVVKKSLTIKIIENEYTYNENPHTIQYSLEGAREQDKESINIEGNLSAINAGKYPVTLTIADDARYVATTHTTLIINQASSSNFAKSYTHEWGRTLTLQDIVLDSGYAWEKPDTHLLDVGEDNYMAIYTPTDTLNYKTERDLIKVQVTKATASVSALESYEFIYNKEGYELYNITPSHNESILTYDYSYVGANSKAVSTTKLDNAGEYTITITLPESAHYKEALTTTVVTITKVQNIDAVVESYDATYEDILSQYALPTSSFGTWSWVEGGDMVVGNAGTTTHTALFTPNDSINYESRSVSVVFNIIKKMVDKPIIAAKKYSGSTLTADIDNQNEYYAITQNAGGIEAGSYNVVLTLKDAANYRWSGESEDSAAQTTLTFVITRNEANVWVKNPTIVESFVYGQDTTRYDVGQPKFSDENNQVSVTFTNKITGKILVGSATMVGEYLVTFSLEETDSYNGLTYTLEFSIKHIQVATPVVANLTWTGESLTAQVEQSDCYTVVENNGGVNVGDYSLKVSLVDTNHKWADGTAGLEKTINYKINKALDNGWTTEPSISNWTYTKNGGVAGSVAAKYGKTIVKYKLKAADDSEYTDALPINAGTYVAKFSVDNTNNYNGVDAKILDFIIAKATPILTAPTYDMSIAYYQNNIDVTTCYLTSPKVDAVSAEEAGNNFTFANPVLDTTTITSGQSWERVGFDVNYNSASPNFESTKITAYINLYKVSHIEGRYFGSIEDSVVKAISGETIMVIPDASGNVTIASDITIKEGVSLILPYLNKSGQEEVNADGKATLINDVPDSGVVPDNYAVGYYTMQLTTKVVVKQNVTITNNGTLTIAGELAGGGVGRAFYGYGDRTNRVTMVGHTARYYAKLILEDNAKIISNSNSSIYSYGFIDELSSRNGSKITIDSGATAYVPFMINDFAGGVYMKGCADDKNKVSPFNRYEVRNILPEMTINYGGKLVGYANIWASSLNLMNSASLTLVGVANNDLIQLTTIQSYITFKYDPDYSTGTSGKDDWYRGSCYINAYGGAKLNSIKMTVYIVSKIDIDTALSTLSIPYTFDISLYNGSYEILNKTKLMPGAKLFVDSTATLTLGDFTVYNDWEETLSWTTDTGSLETKHEKMYNFYVGKLPEAKLIVNGKLIVSALGGRVYTSVNGAELQVTTPACKSYEAKVAITEVKTLFGVAISKKFVIKEYHVLGESLDLIFAGEQSSEILNITSGGKYISQDGTWVLQTA